ncbi:MAG: transglycosylase domain-containing protein [Bacilli bacterium]
MARKRKSKLNLKNKKIKLTIAIIGASILTLLVITLGWFWSILLLGIIVLIPLILKSSNKIKNVFKKPKHTKRKSKNHRNKKKKKRTLKIVLLIMLFLGLIGLLSVIGVMIYVASTSPEFDPNNLYTKETTIIYDSENNVIAELGLEKRENISFNKLPQVLIDAIIATEDSRFYQHNGFDLPRFSKATMGQLTGNSEAGGGSTLTMQVVKNAFTSFDQTIVRKLTDIYMAIFKLEKNYTKEEIIEFYVNTPYLGGGSYGVQQASRTYFDKSVSELNLAEAALIAGLFQSPGAYDPFLYPDKAENRRGTVLYLMKRHGYITQEQYDIAKAITITDMIKGQKNKSLEYQGYIDVVIDEVIKKSNEEYNPYDTSMEIYTNMVKSKQDHANKIINGEAYKFRNDTIQTGFAVTETKTGKVVAIGAGRNRDGERKWNYATMIKRQPGSTAKPLFDYGPAFEFSNWSPATPVLDEPTTYSDGKPINNADGKYFGLITARQALKGSRNIPALNTFKQMDNKSIVAFVTSLGIKPEISNDKVHEAHAIGGFNGVSPLEMAGAYSAFSNGGYYIQPYTVSKIVLKETGETIEYKPQKERVMKDTTAFLITDILKGKSINGVPVSHKTGTSNLDSKREKELGLPANTVPDAWVVGYSPDYAIAMWYGYDETTKEHYMTTSVAWSDRMPLFNAIAKGIIKKAEATKFPGCKNVHRVTIEKETIPAMLPSQFTPDDMKFSDYFIKGTEPVEVSPRYSQFDDVANLDGEYNSSSNQVTLTWNEIDLPNHLTTDYLDNYYANAYGKFKDKYLTSRLNYDKNKMGIIGYNIYSKNKTTGALTLLGFTTNNSYTYTVSSSINSITYVVKTAYSKYKNNQSNGSEITLSIENNIYFNISLNGSKNILVPIGSKYEDNGFEYTVLDDGINVTESASTAEYTILPNKSTVSGIAVDTSVTGLYVIKYIVSYGGQSEKIERNVTVQ